MKTFKILTFSLFFFLLGSCERNDLHDSPIDSVDLEKSKFVQQLKFEISKVSKPKNSEIEPENLFNLHDNYGRAIESLILNLNNLESTQPANSRELYLYRAEHFMDSIFSNFTLTDVPIQDPEIAQQLSDLIQDIGNFDDPHLSVEQLKTFEILISETDALSELEKMSWLIQSATIKYAIATIAIHGIVMDGIVYSGEDIIISAASPCYGNVFRWTVMENYSVLTDTDSPFLMFGAWAGLPATLGWGMADGVYQAIKQC
jgi:hypothetical protein